MDKCQKFNVIFSEDFSLNKYSLKYLFLIILYFFDLKNKHKKSHEFRGKRAVYSKIDIKWSKSAFTLL